VHPSVHRRFAAPEVDENGVCRAYRPANLAADPRFIWWYGGRDPDFEPRVGAEEQADYAVEAEAGMVFKLGAAEAALAALLKTVSVDCAAGIFPGAPTPTPDTAYADAIALQMLDEELAARPLGYRSLTRLSAEAGGIAALGRLAFGLSLDDARGIARSFGATTLVSVGADGFAELVKLV
jgi:hypothetical protein